jgi:fructose-specific phosphotransferase system component IIB
MEKVFSVGSAPRLYNEDLRRAEIIIESLEMAVELLRRDGNKNRQCSCEEKN